jgi:hypothetical protein
VAHECHPGVVIDVILLDWNSVPADLALVGTPETTEDTQKRGLASAIAPFQNDCLATAEGKTEALKQNPVVADATEVIGFERYRLL